MATEKSEEQSGATRHFSFVTIQPVNAVVLRPLNFCSKEKSGSRQVLRRSASQDTASGFLRSPILYLPTVGMDINMDLTSASSSVTSTPTMVRSRPRIPSELLSTNTLDIENATDNVGVIRTDWSKYRRRSKQLQSIGGHGFVSTHSLPSTPKISPILSPDPIKSASPERAISDTTLTRMGSVKSKLQELKDDRDLYQDSVTAEQWIDIEKDCYHKFRRPVTLQKGTSDDKLSVNVSRAASTYTTPSNTAAEESFYNKCKETTESEETRYSEPDSASSLAARRHISVMGGNERVCGPTYLAITDGAKNEDKRCDKQMKLVSSFYTKSTDSEASSTSTHLLPTSSLDKDSDEASLHVTEDEDSETLWSLMEHPIRLLKDSSIDTEDEGIGCPEGEENFRKCRHHKTPVIEPIQSTETEVKKISFTGLIPRITLQTKLEDTMGPKTDIYTQDGDQTSIGGRFLTHPPIKDRVGTRESGSVDSNGLGPLRESVETKPKQNRYGIESGPNESVVSLADSYISQGENSETPRYHDVIRDVLAETTDFDKHLDRKNNKSIKQKSKSDPSGEKNGESIDIPYLMTGSSPQTTSSPVLPHKNDEPIQKSIVVESGANDTGKIGSQKRYGSTSDRGRLSNDNKQANQDSSEDTCVEPNLRPQKRSLKKRIRDRTKGQVSARQPSIEDKLDCESKSQDRSGPSETASRHVERKLLKDTGKSATAPSTPLSLSPENTLDKNTRDQVSLTLPLAKKTSLTRSHSSASVFLHKRSVSTGARPKDLQDTHRKLRANTSQDFDSDFTPGRRGWSHHFSPSLEPIFSQSTLSLFEGAAEEKDKRDLIVREFYSSEQQYVETLQMLVEKYMIPMKTQGILESSLVDDIFYKVNEIYMHHVTFLTFLKKAVEDWNNQTTIGDVIHKNFSKQTVIENYVSFIENFPRAEKVLDEMSTKSSFQKYIETIERDNRSKLPLKAQIVKPAQRIPRYELLLKRLLEYTPEDHPDNELLKQAEGAIHALALKINSVKESKHEEDLHETVKKLELLLITDQNRKDQHCVWLFTDLVVISSIKRKSGPVNRKTSLLLQSPLGTDFVENMKHKLLLKVSIDDLEIVKVETDQNKRQLTDRDQLEADFILLSQISDLANQLKYDHQQLDESIKDVMGAVNKELSEHQLKSPPPEAHKIDMVATTTEGVSNITLVFSSPEKRASWESMFLEAKEKLCAATESSPPEFLQALQITKTRAGMQFSCAAPIDGPTPNNRSEVWVCNSDGYVGHMCLLGLHPEPIVTLNTPVPGCNSRILCICAIPAFKTGCRRRGSQRRQGISHPTPPKIKIEESNDIEDGYASDSSSTDSDQNVETKCNKAGHTESTYAGKSMPASLEPSMSTMWLGTEEGCILIFPSTENIKTTKCKIKIQHSSGVLCIVHADHSVFVSLANGDVVVYRRKKDGAWDMTSKETLGLGTVSSPVTKMMAVSGKVWCASKQTMSIISPFSLEIEKVFPILVEGKGGVQSMVCSGQAVWLALQNSSKIKLYHGTTNEHLLDVNIAHAVANKLQTSDDIIRQHKSACLRITALLTCKELLWIGTSAGVVLSLQMPKITPTTTKSTVIGPHVSGRVHGHTGHVRFLTSVEISSNSMDVSHGEEIIELNGKRRSRGSRRPSVSSHTLGNASRMLVISGGDGYEDFQGSTASDAAGRDDSTNHLLLWQM